MLVLRWFNMLTVQAGHDGCVGNECSDIEADLMRQGGRMSERLIVKERESFTCKKLTIAD